MNEGENKESVYKKNNRIYNEKFKIWNKMDTKIHTKFLANCYSWMINSHAASRIYKFIQLMVGKILSLNINYLLGYTMFPNGKYKL